MIQMKRKFVPFAVLSAAALVVATWFNACSGYSDAAYNNTSASSVVCDNTACVTPTLDNLSVKVNLGSSADFQVPPALADFNLGGDCNEGGYPYNTIVWELYLNGVKVRDSNMLGMAGSVPVNSRCVNGRFLLYVSLIPIGQDNVDRRGLQTSAGGVRTQYDLYIEVYGQSTLNGAGQRNPLKGRTHVSLLPIGA